MLELIKYLTHLAKKRGLMEFTTEVLIGISRSFTLLDWMGLTSRREMNSGVYEMRLMFRDL